MLSRIRTRSTYAIAVFLFIFWTFAASAGPPPPIEAYGMLPMLDQAQLSPDGTMVAYLSSAGGHRCLIVRFLDIQKTPNVDCPNDLEVRWFHWKTNNRILLGVYKTVFVAPRMITRSALFAVDIDSTKFTQLVQPRQGRLFNFNTDNVVDFLENDPNNVLVTLSTSSKYPDVVAINVNTGAQATAVASTDHIVRWMSDMQGRPRLGVTVVDDRIAYLYRPEASSDFIKVEGTDVIGTDGFVPLAFSDQPNVIYVASNHETGRRCVYLYDIEAKKIVDRYACQENADIDSLIFSGRRVVGYMYADDQHHQIFTDPAWRHDSEAIARKFPNGSVMLLGRTADGTRELVKVYENSLPPSTYVLARIPGQPTTLNLIGDERPALALECVAPVKPVTYRARDGLQIHGYLTMPLGKTTGPIPFVVLPHGGPYARDYLGFDYIAQMIASRGYGVLQPNFRGSTGYGNDFLSAGFREWGRKMQDDITDGTKWLMDEKLADPARICIVGWSYGGYAALMAAIREPKLYKCAASMAGPTDLRNVQPGSGKMISDIAVPILNGDKSLIDQNSPVKSADKISIPVLLAHGLQDVNVSIEDTLEMEKALKSAGKSVDSIYFEGDDHFLFIEGDRIAFLKKLDEFLRTNLGPSPVN